MSDNEKKALLKKLADISAAQSDQIGTAYDGFFEELRAAQKWLAETFFDEMLAKIEVKDGKIVSGTANIRRVTGTKVFNEYYKTWGQRFLDYIADFFGKIVEVAGEYIAALTGKKKAIDAGVIYAAYGLENGKLVKGGYLESLLMDASAERSIKQAAVRAITTGQSLKDFKASFNTLVNGGELSGVVESQFHRAGFDAFAGFDRAVNNQTAVDLKLNWAIYNGGTMVTTRDFCRARNGKAFTRAEILSWQKLEWQGKNKNESVLTSLGGHNCRHVLSWITEELYNQIKNG